MSKQRIVFILLLSLTFLYPLIVGYFAQAYRADVAAAFENAPEEIRPFMDPTPFSGTRYGFLAILLGSVIAVSWLLLLIWRK